MTVLADFTVETEYRDDTPRRVRIVVYDSLKGFRIAASRHANQTRSKRHKLRGEFAGALGLCERFEWQDQDGNSRPDCATVRLAEPHLGVGIVSHEMAHAAVWIRELDGNGEGEPLVCENDEPFAWVLGDLVRQAINGMNEHGVYDAT